MRLSIEETSDGEFRRRTADELRTILDDALDHARHLFHKAHGLGDPRGQSVAALEELSDKLEDMYMSRVEDMTARIVSRARGDR